METSVLFLSNALIATAIAAGTLGTLYAAWRAWCKDTVNLHYVPTEKNIALIEACPILKQKYRFPIWCASTNLHCLYAAVIRRGPTQNYKRDMLLDEEGQTLCIDWVEPNLDAAGKHEGPIPTVIIIPGILGSSQNEYTKNFVENFRNNGWRAAVFNRPGCGNTTLTSHRVPLNGEIRDIKLVVEHVHKKFGGPLFAVGLSLGGNQLTAYAGHAGKDTPLIGAVSFSQGYNFVKWGKLLQTTPYYQRGLLKKWKQFIHRHRHVFAEAEGLDLETILKAETLDQFHKLYTGIEDDEALLEMMRLTSSVTYLDKVAIPMILANALDDPLTFREELLPYDHVRKNPNLILVTTEHGGHGMWAEGFILPNKAAWMDRLCVQFIKALLAQQRNANNNKNNNSNDTDCDKAPCCSNSSSSSCCCSIVDQKKQK